jgi:hypothetical protein
MLTTMLVRVADMAPTSIKAVRWMEGISTTTKQGLFHHNFKYSCLDEMNIEIIFKKTIVH